MRDDLAKKSLVELRELAKEHGLKSITALRKPELIERLMAAGIGAEETGAGVPEQKAESVPAVTEAPSEGSVGMVRETPRREYYRKPEEVSPGTDESSTERPVRRTFTSSQQRAQGNTGRTSYGRQESRYDNRGTYRTDNRNENRGTYRADERQDSRPAYRADERQDSRIDYMDDRGTPLPPGVEDISALDSGVPAYGILEVMPDGFGFIRCENYLPGENDVYVAPSQIRRFNMKTGDIISGSIRIKTGTEKFAAMLYVKTINGEHPSVAEKRKNFEDLTPIFPNSRLHLEIPGGMLAMRVVDLLSPVGKGQRGMIVSPPKAGKTTMLKQIAKAITTNHPDMHLIILLIDERPEDVTDIKESIEGKNVEVI